MAESVKRQSSCTNRQYFASVAANFVMVGFGCATGWVSMALPLLKSKDTPLETGPIDVDAQSWIGCVIAIGAITGNCLCGYIVTVIGTRNTIFMIGFPQMVGSKITRFFPYQAV